MSTPFCREQSQHPERTAHSDGGHETPSFLDSLTPPHGSFHAVTHWSTQAAQLGRGAGVEAGDHRGMVELEGLAGR